MAKPKRPSFTPPKTDAAGEGGAQQPTGWVYRSDDAAETAGAGEKAARPPRQRRVAPPAAAAGAPAAPSAPEGASASHHRLRHAGVLERTLHAVTIPFALALVAVLQPLAWGRRAQR